MAAFQTQIDSDTFERIVSNAPNKTILVLGDVILDEYVSGDVKRISPEAPVPVVDFSSRFYVPGGAANVAANVASLGCRPLLAGVTGADFEATQIEQALQKGGVDADGLLVDVNRPTTVKLRVLAHNQQIVRIDRETRTPIAAALEDTLLAWIDNKLFEADACIVSDYGKGVVTARVGREAIALCRAANVPVLVDPKSLDGSTCDGATIVKPNQHEAERLANCQIQDEATFLEAGEHLSSLLPGTAVLITRGALGMSLFRFGLDAFHAPTVSRNVYDVTGAGDTVISSLGVAVACGASLEQSVLFAGQCAAIAVAKLGTAIVTIDEIMLRSKT